MVDREEHLKWCKQRALDYVEAGDLADAYKSMVSDLTKHDKTMKHPGIHLGMGMLMGGHLESPQAI